MTDAVLTTNRALLDHWYAVAEGVDLGPVPLATTLLGRDYVVWRTPDHALVAAPDRCPHRESPLSLGRVEGGCLVCPYHGWSFGDGGRCVAIPSGAPGGPVPPQAHLPVIHVAERYGLVWLCPGTPSRSIPSMSCDEDPSYRRINAGIDEWATSALRMTDNFLDIAHFPYVHAATLGTAPIDVPRMDIVDLDDGFSGFSYEVDVSNEEGAAASGLTTDVVTRRMTTGFHLPFAVRSTIHYENGLDHIILLLTTPVDDVRSSFTFVVWRNDDRSVPAEDVIAFDRAIGAEDKRMLERVPGTLPLDLGGTVSVRADRASVEWRRQLAALMDG